MNKICLLLIAIAIVSLSSCGSNSDKKSSENDTLKITNNCDNPEWFNDRTLVQEVSRSGKTSSKLDAINEYSYGLSLNGTKLMGRLKIKGEVWCNIDDSSANPKVVIHAQDSIGKNICWQAFGLSEKKKAFHNWAKMGFDFKLPETFVKSDHLSIYVWNPEKKKFYIDDWKIEFSK